MRQRLGLFASFVQTPKRDKQKRTQNDGKNDHVTGRQVQIVRGHKRDEDADGAKPRRKREGLYFRLGEAGVRGRYQKRENHQNSGGLDGGSDGYGESAKKEKLFEKPLNFWIKKKHGQSHPSIHAQTREQVATIRKEHVRRA